MKSRITVSSIFAVSICLGWMGCVSQRDLHQEISSARCQAYHHWERVRAGSEGDSPHVSGQLSLEDALKLAMVNNKALQAVIREKEAAYGNVVSSYSGFLPTISLLGSYTRHDDVDTFNHYELGALNEYSVGVTVTQPLYRGGATRAELRIARLKSCSSDEKVRLQVEKTLYTVTAEYYGLLLAKKMLKVITEAVASSEAYLDEVTKKRDSGIATEYNVLRARVDVSLYKAEMIQQQNKLHLTKTRLLKEMGIDQESEIELSGSLVYHPIKPIFQELVQSAYQNRADLRQAQADLMMSEEAVRLARSRYWPQVNAFASGGWSRPNPHAALEDEWDEEAALGISVEIPLFDGLKREGQVMEKKARLSQRHFELLDAQEQAVFQVRQAILSLRNAEKFVESQEMNLQHAKEGLRMAEVGYSQGMNTEIDVMDARSSLTRAKGLHYHAIYDHAMARLLLQRVSGMMVPMEPELNLASTTNQN